VYSNEFKTLFANVPPMMITEHGAVSPEVAKALAEGIRDETRASIGLSVTGIAGPTGGTEEKPVGLVYIGLADSNGTEVLKRQFPGDRERIRTFATQQALDLLRRRLMES
jgi:nicotinamide-nucleotide amidase